MSILGLNISDAKPIIVGAGFWIRALARLLDVAYAFVVGVLCGFVAAVILAILQAVSVADPGWPTRTSRGRLLGFLVSLIGTLSYHTLGEGIYGATLGKLVCGLRVLSEDMAPCRLKPAVIRSLGYFIDSLVFGWVGYMEMAKTQMEQRHGDHWAKTVVVRSAQVPQGSRRSVARFLLAFVLGSGAWGLPLTAVIVLSALRE